MQRASSISSSAARVHARALPHAASRCITLPHAASRCTLLLSAIGCVCLCWRRHNFRSVWIQFDSEEHALLARDRLHGVPYPGPIDFRAGFQLLCQLKASSMDADAAAALRGDADPATTGSPPPPQEDATAKEFADVAFVMALPVLTRSANADSDAPATLSFAFGRRRYCLPLPQGACDPSRVDAHLRAASELATALDLEYRVVSSRDDPPQDAHAFSAAVAGFGSLMRLAKVQALPTAKRLNLVVHYLRTVHWYCFYSGTQYDTGGSMLFGSAGGFQLVKEQTSTVELTGTKREQKTSPHPSVFRSCDSGVPFFVCVLFCLWPPQTLTRRLLRISCKLQRLESNWRRSATRMVWLMWRLRQRGSWRVAPHWLNKPPSTRFVGDVARRWLLSTSLYERLFNHASGFFCCVMFSSPAVGIVLQDILPARPAPQRQHLPVWIATQQALQDSILRDQALAQQAQSVGCGSFEQGRAAGSVCVDGHTAHVCTALQAKELLKATMTLALVDKIQLDAYLADAKRPGMPSNLRKQATTVPFPWDGRVAPLLQAWEAQNDKPRKPRPDRRARASRGPRRNFRRFGAFRDSRGNYRDADAPSGPAPAPKVDYGRGLISYDDI